MKKIFVTSPLPSELSAMARICVCAFSDYAIQLSYLVSQGQWDKAAKACTDANLALNQLAGCVSQLIPVSACQDAPMAAEKSKDG